MKIAALHYPRSGSTRLVSVLANASGAPHMTKIIKGQSLEESLDRISALWKLDDYVIKVETISTLGDQFDTIDWQQFDHVIKLTRSPLVDSYISFQVAAQRKNYVKFKEDNLDDVPFEVDMASGVNYLSSPEFWYQDGPAKLKKWTDNVEAKLGRELLSISYDEIKDDALLLARINSWGIKATAEHLVIPTKPSNIDYKKSCTNYQQVVDRFSELGLV